MLQSPQILFVSLLLINFQTNHGRNACSSNSCKNKQLCKFQQSRSPARHCMNLEILIKTDNDKKSILEKINSRRNKVASGEIKSFPSSDAMMKLEWNSKLELSAQRWANQCVKNNSPDVKDACRDFDGVEVGQNIASVYGVSPGLLPTALVDIWYMELLNINGSVLPRFRNSVESGPHYDYFTQLVWANTTEVGCGCAKFQERLHDQENGKNRTVYRLVCNFAPSGNREEHAVYNPGPPCSKCPKGTTCDTVYKALCRSIKTNVNNKEEANEKSEQVENLTKHYKEVTKNITTVTDVTHTDKLETNTSEVSEDDNYNPFDYYSHFHDFTMQTVTLRSSTVVCKDLLAVDAFIDILRKKLSNDHNFKEMFTIKPSQGISDATFSDPSVAAFVEKIYSKFEPSTTMKTTERDLLNSTLLVDLVEAVIFRSGGKSTIKEIIELSTPIISDVSPIKVQAEFAQVQQNDEFTGHYFFPEDNDETTESGEPTESYYDSPNLSISDVIMEIEDIKKNTVTRNFLDEILEMESSTERTTTTLVLSPGDWNAYKSGHESMKKFLEDIKEQSGEKFTRK